MLAAVPIPVILNDLELSAVCVVVFRGKKPAMKRQVSGAQRGAQQLLRWCQHKTRYYEVRETETERKTERERERKGGRERERGEGR